MQKFTEKGETPWDRTLVKYEEWAARKGYTDSSADAQAGAEQGYDLPDVSFLKPHARAYYDARLGSYLQRAWPRETIERASRELIASIVGANTLRASGAGRAELSDEEQLMVLEGIAEHVEREYGPKGTGRA